MSAHPYCADSIATEVPGADVDPLSCAAILRALRDARGVTQEGWAALLGVSRATVGRWESGHAVPNAEIEHSLLAHCYERGLFHGHIPGPHGPFQLTPAKFSEVLAAARLNSSAPTSSGPLSSAGQDNVLPVPLTAIIDRTSEVAEIRQLLRVMRLVTLTGPGGVGKTRLAIAVAGAVREEFPDGLYYVALASLTNHRLVLTAIAQALKVRDVSDQSLLECIRERLQHHRALMIIDNFEHLLEAAAVVVDILSVCPLLRVIVTSREPLHIHGEQEFHVSAFAVPEVAGQPAPSEISNNPAVQLFATRARAVNPHFTINFKNGAAVLDICRKLDGLPLAIELAAVRLKVLSPESLASRLNEYRLRLLTSGGRDLPHRHQTLFDTIKWTHDLLTDAERTLFRRIAVFAGGCTLEAIEAVCGFPIQEHADAFDLVYGLVDKSLLQATAGQDGDTRYHLLQTVREFALAELEHAGELNLMRTAHIQWLRALARPAILGFPERDHEAWLRRAGAELENVRAALAWSLNDYPASAAGVALAGALQPLWSQSHVREGCYWLEQFLATEAGSGTSARAGALLSAAQLTIYRHGFYHARGYIDEALALARTLGRHGLLVQALSLQATAYRDDASVARPTATEAATLARSLGHPALLLRALYTLGWVALWQGDLALAQSTLLEAVERGQESGIYHMTAAPLRELGNLALREGRYADARQILTKSVELLRELDNEANVPQSLASLARVAQKEGSHAEAWSHYLSILQFAIAKGGIDNLPLALSGIASLYLDDFQPERAALWFGAAEAYGKSVGLPMGELYIGEHQAALTLLREQLSTEKREMLWQEGRGLSLNQIIDKIAAEAPNG